VEFFTINYDKRVTMDLQMRIILSEVKKAKLIVSLDVCVMCV
jgi:hypothetical protein